MAFVPRLNSHYVQGQDTSISIEAWTEQTAMELNALSLSDVGGSLASIPFSIQLDMSASRRLHVHQALANNAAVEPVASVPTYVPLQPSSKRDSLKRREAVLKGREGSRKRQRWENGRMLNNPYAQPPLPSDWEVRPTYPVRSVPYYLAPLWEVEMAERSANDRQNKNHRRGENASPEPKIPRDLREKLKRTKAAKGLLQTLEEQVRAFIQKWEEYQNKLDRDGLGDVDSSDEDEIVFVGRDGRMRDQSSSSDTREPIPRTELIFESLVDDNRANFGRWLVHSLASYYGLRTWSRTIGDPARREAYIGIKEVKREGRKQLSLPTALPRPLWEMM